MIHSCPACGWRYGHAPTCPFATEPAETAVYWGAIVLVGSFWLGIIAFAC